MDFNENPLASIFESIPEFRKLSISGKSHAYAFIERRVDKLALKIKLSPYEPLEANDKLHLNHNFPNALLQWLEQFPPEHRLGFLAAALSTTYITQAEETLFREIAMQHLQQEILREEQYPFVAGKPLPSHVNDKIRAYPISLFGAYDDLVHRLPIEATRDRDRQPSHNTLDGFLESVFESLSYLVEYKDSSQFIYRDQSLDTIKQVVLSLVGSHVLLVEDASFSGTRIQKSVSRFLDLLHILFVQFADLLKRNYWELPRVYLVVPIATNKAFERIKNFGQRYRRFFPVFGFLFDQETNTTNKVIPATLKELDEILPQVELSNKLQGAIDFFHENYGTRYWEETGVITTYKYNLDDLRFGYGGDGWTIVRCKNSPNNSLPILWYPHTKSSTSLNPLFARIDSHQSHANAAVNLGEVIETVKEDKNGNLRASLLKIYSP